MFEVFNGQSRSMKIVKPSLHGHIIIKTSNFHHCKNCPSLMHPYQIFRQWDQHSRNWHTARYPCHVILHNINLSGQAQFYIISHIWQHSHLSFLYENRNKQQKEQSPYCSKSYCKFLVISCSIETCEYFSVGVGLFFKKEKSFWK